MPLPARAARQGSRGERLGCPRADPLRLGI